MDTEQETDKCQTEKGTYPLVSINDGVCRQLFPLDITSHYESNSAQPADVFTEFCLRLSGIVVRCLQPVPENYKQMTACFSSMS